MSQAIIKFEDVCKSFGANHILKGLELAIKNGEIITIIGGSGMGKTVFLKLLLGILHPSKGAILFKNKVIENMSEEEIIEMRTHIGMLFQGAALFDSMTVAENIAYPLREHFNYSDEEIYKKVAKRLELVGLPGTENLMPAELSGGMKKRVGLARAIAADPDVILYDEPTTGLDPANTHRIINLIAELNHKLGVTSVVVTHDLESAFTITNRLAMIYHGKFGFVGTPDEAKKSDLDFVRRFLSGEMETGDG